MWAAEPDADLAWEIQQRGNPDIRVVQAGLPGPLPFPSGRFHLVTCLDVLEHVDDDAAAMRELARVVAPGGFLLVTVPAHPHLWSAHDVRAGHRRRYTRDALAALAEAAGLETVLLSPFNVWLYPAAAVARRLGLAGTAFPPRPLNAVLAAILASEGRLAKRWPPGTPGLSWILLGRKIGGGETG